MLSNTCMVAFQADAIRYMLQKPILSGRIERWDYALIEYNLTYESMRVMQGEVITDSII
jgi:hypothetical protein